VTDGFDASSSRSMAARLVFMRAAKADLLIVCDLRKASSCNAIARFRARASTSSKIPSSWRKSRRSLPLCVLLFMLLGIVCVAFSPALYPLWEFFVTFLQSHAVELSPDRYPKREFLLSCPSNAIVFPRSCPQDYPPRVFLPAKRTGPSEYPRQLICAILSATPLAIPVRVRYQFPSGRRQPQGVAQLSLMVQCIKNGTSVNSHDHRAAR
jgi:hypothetical protein